jgi:hypothetical protein
MKYQGLYNVNARRCSEGGIYVQYQQEGQAKDRAFSSWNEFLRWFHPLIEEEIEDVRKVTEEVRARAGE